MILFVADGLRSEAVTPADAPTLAAIRAEGVDLRNSHSLYPTLTTVNASAIATGHGIGDTGDFGNLIYTGAPLPGRKGAPVAALENDEVLVALNTRYGGNYLGAPTLLSLARRAGYSVARGRQARAAAIQARGDTGVLVIDDGAGPKSPFPLPPSRRDRGGDRSGGPAEHGARPRRERRPGRPLAPGHAHGQYRPAGLV